MLHTLEAVLAAREGSEPLLEIHFHQNYPLPDGEVFDAGDVFAGLFEILRRYRGYPDLPAPWFRFIEVKDGDGDGLPDVDARLPCDEARFGSSPDEPDSDGDGLFDLEEYCSGVYRGGDPARADTDGDGTPDGADPYPLSTFSGVIPFGTPARGELPEGLLSRDVFFSGKSAVPRDVRVHASWDERALYFCLESPDRLEVFLHIDGSGRLGPFESDARIPSPEGGPEGSDVYARDAVLSVVVPKRTAPSSAEGIKSAARNS